MIIILNDMHLVANTQFPLIKVYQVTRKAI